MSSDAAPTPPRPNRFWPRRDAPSGSRWKDVSLRSLLFLFAMVAIYLGLAYKAEWFPFNDRARLAAEIRIDVVGRFGFPVDQVEVTGDGQAVGTLPGGERLAIRWKRAEGQLLTLAQRPKADLEVALRVALEKQFGSPVKELAIGPAPNGVGYIGEAWLESGLLLDVMEETKLDEFTCHQWAWHSPKNYIGPAKRLLEKETGQPVVDVLPGDPRDFPTKEEPNTFRLYTGRMRTAQALYAVEYYRDKAANDPNGLQGHFKLRTRTLSR